MEGSSREMDSAGPVAANDAGFSENGPGGPLGGGDTVAQQKQDAVPQQASDGSNATHNRRKRAFDIVGSNARVEPASKIHSPIQELSPGSVDAVSVMLQKSGVAGVATTASESGDGGGGAGRGRSRVAPPTLAGPLPSHFQQAGLPKDIRDHRNTIMRFLKEHAVHDLLPASGTSIIFDSELPVRSAFHALQEQQLVAAPIWDSNSQRLTGMLTVTTFIEILLHYCDQNNLVKAQVGNETIKHWLEVLGRSKEGLITLDPDASLYKACEQLRKYRVHRLPVVEDGDDQCVLFVVTHLKMLKFLLSRLDSETSILKSSLGDLGVGTFSKVVTCTMETTMAVVLRLLYQNNITALPVVDDAGTVLNLLARVDVLCVAREQMYHNLNITVGETIALRQKQAAGSGEWSSDSELHTCKRSDSLLHVFQKLAANNTHRLIIVDDQQKLEGVVSLSDMFHLFLA